MTIGIVGCGLIGGSVGLALRKPGRTIQGYDPDPAAVQVALGRQCIDEAKTLEQIAQADVVILAGPPATIVPTLDLIHPLLGEGTVVTDCASTKADIVRWTQKTRLDRFVPGHPMAGHEKSGAGYSSAWLFRHAKWVLCPLPFTDRAALRRIEELVRETGAEPVRMNAATHDRQVAIVSHLPHILAAVLVRLGTELDNVAVAGGSWKDLTRVGGVDPELWTQILLGNREEVLTAMDSAEAELGRFRTALQDSDGAALKRLLEAAVDAKGSPPAQKRPIARPKRSKRR